jgi:hypothetical protein
MTSLMTWLVLLPYTSSARLGSSTCGSSPAAGGEPEGGRQQAAPGTHVMWRRRRQHACRQRTSLGPRFSKMRLPALVRGFISLVWAPSVLAMVAAGVAPRP